MWRRKKSTSQESRGILGRRDSKEAKKTKDGNYCDNCFKLLQENSQLKERIAILEGGGKRKKYTIAPTLYTFHKNNVQKNRISRYVSCLCVTPSAASQVTQSIFDFEDEKDTDAYNEEIISHCADPMPSSFFLSEDFLDAFENQCEEISTVLHNNL